MRYFTLITHLAIAILTTSVYGAEPFRLHFIPGAAIDVNSSGTLSANGTDYLVLGAAKVNPSMSLEGRYQFKENLFLSPLFNWTQLSAGSTNPVDIDNFSFYLPIGLTTKINKFQPWISGGGGLVIATLDPIRSTSTTFDTSAFTFGITLRAGVDYELSEKYSMGAEVSVNTASYDLEGRSGSTRLSADVTNSYVTIGIRFGVGL